MGGSDLLDLLIEWDTFLEDFTRFYVAKMVLVVESCHSFGFIHRDVKPYIGPFSLSGLLKSMFLPEVLIWPHRSHQTSGFGLARVLRYRASLVKPLLNPY